jgi:aminoacylase
MALSGRAVGAFIASCALALFCSTTLPPPPVLPSITIPSAVMPAGVLPAVQRLQRYLRIRTDHPSPDYFGAASFLNGTLAALLPRATLSQVELVEGKPIVLATLQGEDPSLPALLLNSHTDVVPAEPSQWHWDPFAADIAFVDYEWRIYARGSQDMKCVGMQYVEALSELTAAGWKPKRSIVVSFVPDEEIGGLEGLGTLVGDGKNELWRSLNIGAELDEGLPNPKSGFNVYYGERQPWWLVVEAASDPGHGALSPETTGGQMIARVISRALAFRAAQRGALDADTFANNNVGGTVGVNLVFMESGIKSDSAPSGYLMNLIPSGARCGFDIRVPPHIAAESVDAEIASWMLCDDGERCPGLSYTFVHKVNVPDTTDAEHPFARAFMQGLEEARAGVPGPVAHPGIFFAATDARFVRRTGVPSIGFSPMELMPVLLHKHDEFITVDGYLSGIKVYKSILQRLGGDWQEGAQAADPPVGGARSAAAGHDDL